MTYKRGKHKPSPHCNCEIEPNGTAKLRFLNRINFSNSKNNAKFPSMLVIMR